MHGRVVIPIRNSTGELVAYAGRAVNEGWTQVQTADSLLAAATCGALSAIKNLMRPYVGTPDSGPTLVAAIKKQRVEAFSRNWPTKR